jgi:hypothetical protein
LRSASISPISQRGLAKRARQHLHRHLEQQPERAEGTGQQARHVVAGHVLHHLAAEGEHFALPVHQVGAEHEDAHRAAAGAARARQAARNRAAERGADAEVRRLEGQHLAAFRQRRFDVRQRRATARRDDKFGWLVIDDAGIGARVEDIALKLLSIPVLGAAAADAQPTLRDGRV